MKRAILLLITVASFSSCAKLEAKLSAEINNNKAAIQGVRKDVATLASVHQALLTEVVKLHPELLKKYPDLERLIEAKTEKK